MEENSVLVMIVEDDREVRELLQATLEEGGFAVLPASSAEEAIALMEHRGETIRALVADIILGSTLTGWDVARHSRGAHPGIPVVYTTGSEGRDWTSLGVPNSILIEKPYAPSQVLTAVAQLLNAAVAASGVQQPPTSEA
jgi:CheY-like chemotaxis protein